MTSLSIDISLIVEDLGMGTDFIIFIGICLHYLFDVGVINARLSSVRKSRWCRRRRYVNTAARL